MNTRAMRIWIGLFVLLTLGLFCALIILFGSAPTLFKRTNTYYVRFADAPNVSPGTPVRRSGVQIGEVKSIDLDEEEGNVKVTLALDPKYKPRKNEEPILVSGLLGSDSSIDLVPRKPEGEKPQDRSSLEPGAEMQGIRQATVNTVLSQASGVVPTAQDTLNDLRKSIQRIEKTLPLFEDTLKEFRDLARSAREVVPSVRQTTDEIGELAKEVRRAVPNLTKTSDEIRELAKSVREAVPDVRRIGDDVGAAARSWGKLGERLDVLVQANQDKIVKVVDNTNDVLTRMGAALSDNNLNNIGDVLKNIGTASTNFDGISRNIDYITHEGRTSVRLLNDTLKRTDDVMKSLEGATNQEGGRIGAITKNLDESLEKLNSTLTDVRELVRVAGQADGTLSRLLSDPSLYNHLDEAACMIPKLIPRLERILKDAETFADKLARHPELIGVGGAVRPSSGLKDAPSSRPDSSYYPPPGPR
jgi:phospholipid/cholesterol/gamma-HCH transport system substrate-binding protein